MKLCFTEKVPSRANCNYFSIFLIRSAGLASIVCTKFESFMSLRYYLLLYVNKYKIKKPVTKALGRNRIIM